MMENTHLTFRTAPPMNSGKWLLIGALGAGMRAFADMLLDAGESVVGTDQEVTPDGSSDRLSGQPGKFKIFSQDCVDQFLATSPHRVVYSTAVPDSSPLLQRLRSLNFNLMALPEALNHLLQSQSQICVAGTHGKTTTSGMTWSILQYAGVNPSAYVGGVMKNQMRSGVYGAGGMAVLESCEYRQSFLHLSPKTIVLTGIESDHFDCFSSPSDCDQTFSDFIARLPTDGTLIFNQDCKRSAAIAATCGRRTFSFSLRGFGDLNAVPCDEKVLASRLTCSSDNTKQTFLIRNKTTDLGLVHLQVPGIHNRQNAVGAIAAAVECGMSVETAIRGIAEFSGMQRRFEHRGEMYGIDWIDDYAHHPTAIQVTLQTARTIFPNRRVIAVFEPHQVSRLSALFDDFRSALLLADECLILPVLPARENASKAQCNRVSGTLVRSISESGGRAFLMTNLDQVLRKLDHSGRPGDVVITMGAGRTYQIHDEIHRRLQRNSAA